MTKKLQAVRLRLDDGREHVFFGPAILPNSGEGLEIQSIDFSSQLDYEDSMAVNDLWLLVQDETVAH